MTYGILKDESIRFFEKYKTLYEIDDFDDLEYPADLLTLSGPLKNILLCDFA